MSYYLGLLMRCIVGFCLAALAGVLLVLIGVHPVIPAAIGGVLAIVVAMMISYHPTVSVRHRAFIYEATLVGLLVGPLVVWTNRH